MTKTIDALKVQDAYHYALAAAGGYVDGCESAFVGEIGNKGRSTLARNPELNRTTYLRKAYQSALQAGCTVNRPRKLADAPALAREILAEAREHGICAAAGEPLCTQCQKYARDGGCSGLCYECHGQNKRKGAGPGPEVLGTVEHESRAAAAGREAALDIVAADRTIPAVDVAAIIAERPSRELVEAIQTRVKALKPLTKRQLKIVKILTSSSRPRALAPELRGPADGLVTRGLLLRHFDGANFTYEPATRAKPALPAQRLVPPAEQFVYEPLPSLRAVESFPVQLTEGDLSQIVHALDYLVDALHAQAQDPSQKNQRNDLERQASEMRALHCRLEAILSDTEGL